MADISMCIKEDCPSFKGCYRAQATPNPYRQSYALFDNKSEDFCDMFIPYKNLGEENGRQ